LIRCFANELQLVDICVQLLSGGHHHCHDHTVGNVNYESCEACGQRIISPHNVGQSDDPVAELNEWHERADRELEEHNHGTVDSQDNMNDNSSGDGTNEEMGGEIVKCEDEFNDDGLTQKQQLKQRATSTTTRQRHEENVEAGCIQQRIVENPPAHSKNLHEDHKLITMGISTALAIGIHNFPEGLATFVASLHDPSVGAVLAIAIGIHNIPEGLCVALPIYYATGNRCKAFGWACLSGASEPVAALLGWAILAQTMSQVVYAILFGIVAGMMVIISMKELLPTAHRYDNEDTVVTYSFVGGMALISLSLVLFQI
jgi:zinc transporter ZupT